MKQPRKTSTTSEGNWLVLSRAPHKMGVIERKRTKVEQRFIKALCVTPIYCHRSHYKCQGALNTFGSFYLFVLEFCLHFSKGKKTLLKSIKLNYIV